VVDLFSAPDVVSAPGHHGVVIARAEHDAPRASCCSDWVRPEPMIGNQVNT